jgi:hypothetical protein
MKSLQTIRAELRSLQVTVWQGKKTHDHIKDLLVVVDEKTGKITEYKKIAEHTNEGVKSGEIDGAAIYGNNGFERARILERATIQHQEEAVD